MHGKAGFVGLGAMGAPMARRLAADGALIVYDNRPEAMRPFGDIGVELASSVKAVGEAADVVFLCLPNLEAARDVLLGADGLASGSGVSIVVDLSTTGAEFANQMAQRLEEKGVTFISAPVSGGVAKARDGSLSIMMSGAPHAVEAIGPYVAKIAAERFDLGAVAGQAQTMKLLNNILSTTAFAATCEVMIAGVKAGLDPELMIKVLNASSGRNSATVSKFPRSVLTRKFDNGAMMRITAKDADLCLGEAEALGVSLTIAQAARALWESALAKGAAEMDSTRLITFLEREHGVEVGGRSDRAG